MGKKTFKTEVSDLLNLIIHSLYSNKEIFIRELVSNASDAIDKLKYLSLTDDKYKDYNVDGKIEITFDEKKKILVIKDNGLGMNEEDLNKNLGTIASSGTKKFLASLSDNDKKNSNLIGQFGVGFYSAFMVADKVEVVSLKAGEEEAFKWVSKGKESYSVDKAERLEGHGTSIILSLNDEGEMFASRWELDTLIKKYSDHIAYKIYLEYDKETYDNEGKSLNKTEHVVDQVNTSSALWTRSKSSITDQEYKDFYKNNYSDNEDPLFYLHTHAEGATDYKTLFYIPKKAPFDMNYADYKPGVKLYVKRVYITDDDKELLPPYLRFVRGVIDSEDLPLNVSREILQNNKILSAIRNGSIKKILGELKKLAKNNPDAYVEFIKQYNRPLKEGLYSDYANRDALLELVRYKTSEKEGYTSLAEYKSRMKEDQKDIYYLTGGNESILRNSPLLKSYKSQGIEVLILDDDIDDIVVSTIYEYEKTPLKAINKSGSINNDEDKKDSPEVVLKIKELLKDDVKDVIASSRLVDAVAVIVMDENDPTIQMQHILKQMGGGDQMPEIKPILEINLESDIIKKFTTCEDEEYLKDLASVVLGQALLAEGVMPKDPALFASKLTTLLSK